MNATGSALFVFERGRDATAVQVLPTANGVAPNVITEAKEYVFELRDVADVWNVDLLIDDLPVQALRPRDRHTARWAWSPGFYAGGVEMTLRAAGAARVRFELVTDPDRRKLTRHNFETMVREVLEDTFALFALSSHRFGVGQGVGKSPPIARLEFLRSRLTDLERTVRRINDRPVRILHVEERLLPLHKARTLTGPELERSLRTSRVAGMVPMPNRAPGAPKLPLPERVRKTAKAVNLDIPEHQQMKWALTRWHGWLVSVADRLSTPAADGSEQRSIREGWAVRCRGMSRRIGTLLALPLFEDVSDRPGPVTLSSVYRRSPAYAEFFRLHRDFSLGVAQVVGDYLQMPLARTFDLYELWCFLRILRVTAERFPVASDTLRSVFEQTADGEITLPSSFVEVPLGHGFAVAYQRRYREYWRERDDRGSFSREMQPDIAITATEPQAAALIVLDAKYRVDGQLNDAIGDIHVYRDALVEPEGTTGTRRIVTAAYVLTPFVPTGTPGTGWRDLELRNRLFHPEYRTAFKFGAATLRPGMSLAEVWELLRSILQDAGVPVPVG